MIRKTYQQPCLSTAMLQLLNYVCGNDSLPYGGAGGPRIAESKERNEEFESEPERWGNLW